MVIVSVSLRVFSIRLVSLSNTQVAMAQRFGPVACQNIDRIQHCRLKCTVDHTYPSMASSRPSHMSRSWGNWEAEPPLSWGNPDDEASFDYDNVPAEVAGEELMSLLASLKLGGILSAKQVCIIAFWASRAGATGNVHKLGLRPDAQSGKCPQRFDKVFGAPPHNEGMYQLPLARRLRHDATRVWDDIPVVPPLEALLMELEGDSEPIAELNRALEADEMPPIYTQHPAVRGAPPGVVVHPISIYLDGVGFSRLDSCLGLWAYFTLTKKRHLLVVLRKSEVCSCGCRGWCSLFPMWQMVAWSLEHLLEGVHPSVRHDGTPFGPHDGQRADRAGSDLGFRAVCILLKCDLAEFSHSLGLPSCQDGISPCPFCFASPDDLLRLAGLSPLSVPCPPKTLGQYLQACAACETRARVATRHAQLDMRAALDCDKRKKDGSHGRAVLLDFPTIGVDKQDRLEPSLTLMNVADFDEAPFAD